MSDFRANTPGVIGMQPITEVSTTQKHPLGMIIKAKDHASTDYGEGEFIYLVGVASTVLGAAVTYDTDGHTTAALGLNAVGNVAVAMAATVASTYGWYQITGTGAVLVDTGFAATAAPCYSNAIAFTVDDAGAAGDMIYGMTATSAINTPSTGLGEVSLQRPVITNNSN